jgi:FtsH-binding integral membrane protein
MESERDDRSTRKILKVIYALLGSALGLSVALVGFNHLWHQPITELQPTHIAIVAGVSLLCGSLAVIDIKKFLVAFFESLGQSWH